MPFIFIFLISLLVVLFAIPSIITVSFRKRLFDDPSESRKVHKRIVPNFGGIAIFTGFLFSCSLFIPAHLLPEANILMAGGLILFMIGLKDDLIGVNPGMKFAAQFLSALIIAMVANIRISDLHGILGIYDMPYYASISLTAIFIVGVVNAFNLIDGIDGLAGSLGIIFSLFYAVLFYNAGELGWSYLSIALTGALIGFLFFNFTPAKIFMGDSGSLLLGFVAAVLSIKFIEVSSLHDVKVSAIHIPNGIALIFSVLIIPIFDTLRVFTLRIIRKTSPFKADSNHLHHRLLFLGMSHIQATLVLSVVNVMFIIMALSLQDMDGTQLISLMALTVLTMNGLLSLHIDRYKKSLLSRETIPTLPVLNKEHIEPAFNKERFAQEVLNKITEN
ncbi:glycosyltransferase family 4 protein [Pedobacter metabolipauper]|uniref:UDP-N-acetylmuramyl pentapeptide phosphotransferase/UDP-N-acetylglucosamine-1-phosphate transferase n=1 Tax=Pedobacter metabolipauper TaxID=425513 RepID=A0A4R6SXK3_9SPHI|nr:MraY family glycosyltransferase [Pedobacter metabolipauper]TDQ09913.1 UDP-N-acetylmuramyl pentapeptide phosphotransferase/UDP-N-acetylglucosamine-1-phosphate transferase [Pedobacter metabolipauper]